MSKEIYAMGGIIKQRIKIRSKGKGKAESIDQQNAKQYKAAQRINGTDRSFDILGLNL